jgi:hypothetical protein
VDSNPQITLDQHFRTQWNQWYREIQSRGIRDFMMQLPEIEPVFRTGRRKICCIDSRVYLAIYLGARDGYVQGIPAAGSLILLAHENLAEAREFVERSGADELWAHSGCGAGIELYRIIHGTQPPTREILDSFVKSKTRDLAEELGIGFGGIIEACHMRKSAIVHPVSSIAYVGCEAYSPFQHDAVPRSFRIARRVHTCTNALKEVKIATDIILGRQGYGDRITSQRPILWIVVGDGDQAAEFGCDVLKQELEVYARSLEDHLKTRINIQGYEWSNLQGCIL